MAEADGDGRPFAAEADGGEQQLADHAGDRRDVELHPATAPVAPDGSPRTAAAPGGSSRTVAGSYTIADAAQLLQVSERTLREWVRSGRIPSLPAIPGERGARIAAGVVEELRQARPLAWDGSHLVDGAAAADGSSKRLAEDAGSSQRIPVEIAGASGATAAGTAQCPPDAAGAPAPAPAAVSGPSGGAGELQAPAVADGPLVAALSGEVSFLREQLVASRQAEEQLRLLLAESTRAVRSLSAALDRPALPAIATAEVTEEGPTAHATAPAVPGVRQEPTAARRRPWWRPWGR